MIIKKEIVLNKYYWILFILILINVFSTFEESQIQLWDEHTLFDYIKNTTLNSNNSDEIKNLHYMIIDPNDYLKNINLNEIKNDLEEFFKEMNVTVFIFIVNNVLKNTDLIHKLKDFVSEIFKEISKININFDKYSTISSLFIVEEKKMRIILGSNVRRILYDLEALNILKKRQDDLNNKNFENLFKVFTKELLSNYRIKLHMYKNQKGLTLSKRYIILVFCLIIPVSFIIYWLIKHSSNSDFNNPIEENKYTYKEKKLIEFINKAKEQNFEKSFENTCIVCLENYEENNSTIENITNNSDEEETNNSYNNLNKEIITIPCDHSFHFSCIYNWLKNERRCPICDSEFEILGENEKNNDNKNKLNIKTVKLNKDFQYNDMNNSTYYINKLIEIQRKMNPLGFNEEFCSKIISNYKESKNDDFKIAKIYN